MTVRNSNRLLILVLILITCISFSGIFSRSLWKRDEIRVAEIGREMWLNHQYAMPTLNRQPFLEKPPLYWWTMAASYRLFGVSDSTARLPSALFGFLTLLFTFLIGRRIGDARTGLFGMLVLATLVKFCVISKYPLADNALIFFVTLGYYGFFIGYRSETSRDKWVGSELMALACGLAFLSKGAVGPALIIGPVVMTLVVRRDFREFKRALPQAGVALLVFLAVVLPWIVNLNTVGGRPAINEYLIQNTLGRIAPAAIDNYTGGHQHPFYYYILEFPQHFFPWIIALPAALLFLIQPPETLGKTRQRTLVTALLLFAGGFLLLSIPATKRGVYLVPIYPLLAVVVGSWFAHAYDQKTVLTPLERGTLQVLSGLLAIVPLAIVLGTTVVALAGIGPKNYDMAPVVRTLRPLLAVIIPLGMVAFFYLGKKAWQAVRTKSTPSCVVLFATAVIFVIVYNEGAVRVMDPVKSIHRFTAGMKSYIKEDSVLAGYKVNEAVRAMIPFDTGRYIQTFEDPTGLSRFLEAHPGALVITLERRIKDLPAALRSRLKLITEQMYSRSSNVQLYENKTSS